MSLPPHPSCWPWIVNSPRLTPDPCTFQSQAPCCLLISKPTALIGFNNTQLLWATQKVKKKSKAKWHKKMHISQTFPPASGSYSSARKPAHSPARPGVSGHPFALFIWEFWCTGRTRDGILKSCKHNAPLLKATSCYWMVQMYLLSMQGHCSRFQITAWRGAASLLAYICRHSICSASTPWSLPPH